MLIEFGDLVLLMFVIMDGEIRPIETEEVFDFEGRTSFEKRRGFELITSKGRVENALLPFSPWV